MASSTSVQATNGYIQQSSGHSNANSIVNSQNTYQCLVLLPDSMKNLKIDVVEGRSYALTSDSAPGEDSPEDDSPEHSLSAPRASSSCFPQNRPLESRNVSFSSPPSRPEQTETEPKLQSEPDAREKGYLVSMRSGHYPQSKVKVRRLNHKTPLPMPEYTPDNILDYMCTLPPKQLDLIPLWDPSPSEKVREVKIGDVGIFNQKGGFETKFNIFSTDNLAEGLKPPPEFVPCRATEVRIKAIEERWETRCGLIAESTDSKYTCSPMGSIDLMNNLPDWAKGYCSSLYLPYGGRTHSIETAALPDIMQYAATQAPSWYCYKNTAQDGKPLKQIYDELRNKSLVVVTEVWNTSTWYSIQTEEPSDLKSLSRRRIKATVQKSTDPKSHICTHVSDSGFVVHTGPESSVLQGREDQCVALKGFQLIYDPKLPLFSPTSERKGGGDGSSILSRLSFFSRKSRKTKRG